MAETTTTPKLSKEVFSVEVKNHELLKLAYDSYLAAGRGANATTLQRGEVRGGGRKPWRQKGTGRARFGSSRNPIWRGGGVVFGPRGNENYTKSISKTSKKVALKQALTLANQSKKVYVNELAGGFTGKTKDFVKALEKADLAKKRRILLVVADKKDTVALRGIQNVAEVKLVSAMYLNVYDILNADAIVFVPEALKVSTEWLTGEEK